MKISFLDGTSIELSWSGDVCYIGQQDGDGWRQIELPAKHIFDVIDGLRTIAKEHSAANGEPPAELGGQE